jgi:membrane associated rhomboid family serine protease
MKRGGTISFSFPPFAGWVRRIIITCTAIFFAELILRRVFSVDLRWVDEWFALIPVFVMKGEFWQLVTYSVLHAGWSHLFFNMLTLWFIGAYLERDWGSHEPEHGHGGRFRRHLWLADGFRHSLC